MNAVQHNTIRIEPVSGRVDRLFILLHGVGANAAGLRPLGLAMQRAFPSAAIVIPDGTYPFDGGNGRQWFSVSGVTEENRPTRVAAALPTLKALVAAEQARYNVGPGATVLGGFSQGAIMSLELAVLEDGMVGHVLSFSGRFAKLPETAPVETVIHFLHGDRDPVIAVQHAQNGYATLNALGGTTTLDVGQGAGHELNSSLVDKAIMHLHNQ
jgi:phospholipase/carboxylesterase